MDWGIIEPFDDMEAIAEIKNHGNIRFIEKQGKDLIFKSGGGITFQSDWKKEYDEMQKKVYVPIY